LTLPRAERQKKQEQDADRRPDPFDKAERNPRLPQQQPLRRA
jgi:hypothetical protein